MLYFVLETHSVILTTPLAYVLPAGKPVTLHSRYQEMAIEGLLFLNIKLQIIETERDEMQMCLRVF